MIIINSIVGAWILAIGGADTVYNLCAILFVFTVVYCFFKIST